MKLRYYFLIFIACLGCFVTGLYSGAHAQDKQDAALYSLLPGTELKADDYNILVEHVLTSEKRIDALEKKLSILVRILKLHQENSAPKKIGF